MSVVDADGELCSLMQTMQETLDSKAFKLLNLTKEWLRTYLPFTLQKIDRVSFGLLSTDEYQRLLQTEPHMPRSRFKLAIPFVGKDVPSRASEFAHPDIIIGLTVLAYRYEGLRRPDFMEDVIALLRSDFEKEVGPYPLRKSSQLYASWVEQAGGTIKGAKKNGALPLGMVTAEEEERTVVPLWLLKQSNDEQMGRLFNLLRKLPACIHHLLEQVIFPSFMQHQLLKLSASGQELGGSMLFGRRIGFSGTPSDLLPLDLGRCGYEKGSEGKMLHVLTDPNVVSTQAVEAGWTVHSLLSHVATASPPLNALIDTGALITGLSNKEVAQQLLALGLNRWCEGVVFLDENDEKMILVKATGRVLKLSQCGIAIEKRFAFYDQIHTTGMDIKHCLSARAALTLGKDMVFRDLAQGAFRMRGIGEGQTVTLLVIPEVRELMDRQLAKAGYDSMRSSGGDADRAHLLDVTSWLVINSMRTERLQFDQLSNQNLSTIWRGNAFEQVHEGHRRFSVNSSAAAGYVLDMLGEAFVSNRDGHVSRARLEGKVIALYFRDKRASGCGNVDAALREIYENYMGGKGVGLEVIQVEDTSSIDAFQSSFREMPWLAVPFSHARRRRALRHLFEVDSESLTVVLLNQEGQVITRDGRKLVELAHTCQRTLDKKAKVRKQIEDEKEAIDKECKKLEKEQKSLEPLLRKVEIAKTKMFALKPTELREIHEFLAEPRVSDEAKRAVDDAARMAADARRALEELTADDLERVRSIEAPSDELTRAVEAVGTLFELRADFGLIQTRLMRSAEGLRRRLLHFELAQVPRNAQARLRSFVDAPVVTTQDGDAVAAALGMWVRATLAQEAAALEAKISVEEVECSPTMAAACEAVADLHGLVGVDDDLRGALLLAAAFGDAKTASDGGNDASTSGETADAAAGAQLEAAQQKHYRIKQFATLLKKDIDSTTFTAGTMRESLQNHVERLSDRHAWMNMLHQHDDEVLTMAITVMLGLVFPDALAKMDEGSDVIDVAGKIANVVNRSSFDKFIGSLRGLEPEITEGRCQVQDFQSLQSMAERLEQRYTQHRFASGGSVPTYLCEWLVCAVKYYASIMQVTTKRAQLKEMQEELADAQKAVKAAEDLSGASSGHGYAAVSAMQVKAVQEEVSKRGASAPATWVRWALQRTSGNEPMATALLVAQPEARRVLAALRDPSKHLLGSANELKAVSPHVVRRVRLALRKDGVRKTVESCIEATKHFPNTGEGAEANSETHASMGELLLFRWALAVCEYVEAHARTQPQLQKVVMLERKIEEKTRSLSTSLATQRRDAEGQARKLEVPAQLFPALQPWQHFPWDAHFLPRSEAEEQVRAAIGLRDLPLLKERLVKAGAVGLSKRSRVCFEAVELRDLLMAQQAMDAAAAAAADAAADTPTPTISERLADDDEPRSPLRGKAASEVNAPPPIVREKTQDVLERLGCALDVFVEPVTTEVPSGLPKPKPFVEVLRGRAEQFDSFVRRSDVQRRDAILATVSSAVGVTDIETEQCREQEQEKAQEQEQEQEIEMERYVDMAYQRDDEEPKRWAFCTLGETPDGQPLAPFASGSFYPASQFRLHSRAPLPFPGCLAVSRNHFNLDWVGERRLKNAVCVLEWVPSMGQLERVAPSRATLSAAQQTRLDDALALLDLRGDGRYGHDELVQVLRAAEHEQPDAGAIEALLTASGKQSLSTAEVRELLMTGALRRGDLGRQFVLLSLAEAETIRCVLHMRQGKEIIPGSDTALALRCIPANDAVLDQTAAFPDATAYQRRIAHQSFRFLDSAMHYRPAELNVLLRSLPAPPAARRLFFSMVVACRRRLAKRWEQTPLAKLFTLDDEWAMLKLEALRVRMREAIKARGLLLHDAFLLCDHDDDGALSLVEVMSALKWLGLPSTSAADVISFVRSLSRSAHISYGAFIELLSTDDETVDVDEGAIATPAPQDAAEIASVCNDGTLVEQLSSMWTARVAAERALDEQLEKEMAAQAERARALVEQQLLDCDFSWMRVSRESGARNPRTTRTSCSYDLTRGTVGTQQGAPLWMEGRGRWFHVRQGSARVPCLKGCGNAFLVLRVPYRKSGGGSHCNTWTVSMMVKFDEACARPLLSTGGWDQWSKMADGDDGAQLVLSEGGSLGTVSTHSSEGGAEGAECAATVKANKWHALSIAVDAVSGVVRIFLDGEEGITVRSSKVAKDGQFSLKGRLALFFGSRANSGSNYYMRTATVHNRVLDSPQVAKEHAMMHALLLEDAIEQVPAALQPTVAAEHAFGGAFESTGALKARVKELRASGTARATELWRALLLEKPGEANGVHTKKPVDTIVDGLQSHDLAVGVRCAFEVKTSAPVEETDVPFGETLLHAAAYVGRLALVDALLAAGAKPRKCGSVSGCSALHAAAAGGHSAVCERLLAAGANVGALSNATRRSALHLACLKVHEDTAALLVSAGGADPYQCVAGGESAMALLRRLGTPEALRLLATLDVLCGTSSVAAEVAKGAKVDGEGGVEGGDDDDEDYDSDEDDEGGHGGSDELDEVYEDDEDGEE